MTLTNERSRQGPKFLISRNFYLLQAINVIDVVIHKFHTDNGKEAFVLFKLNFKMCHITQITNKIYLIAFRMISSQVATLTDENCPRRHSHRFPLIERH